MKKYFYLMRLHKPIGIFLLLWPTLWALWLASAGHPQIKIATIFVLGVVLTRSAGCIINDFADRKFDKFVERTKERPLATGEVSVRRALILFCCLMLIAFILVLFLNLFTILLAVLAAMFAVIYPFLKRFTNLPQLGLGIAFSWGVPMAFAAQTNSLSVGCGFIFLATVLWVILYDTQYAMADRDDDLKIGIKSTAILFGRYDRVIIAMLQLAFLLLMVKVGLIYQLPIFYYGSLLVAGLLFVYQQFLIRERKSKNCLNAFLNNNWVGLVVFAGIFFA